MLEKDEAPFKENDKVTAILPPVRSINTGRGGIVQNHRTLTVTKLKNKNGDWDLKFKEMEGSYPADKFKLSQLSE